MINLTTADVQDAADVEKVVAAARKCWSWQRHLFTNGVCDRGKLMSAAAHHDFALGIVRRLPDQISFQVLPQRWAVERTSGWMACWRHLVRDYEKRLDVPKAMIQVSMVVVLFRRIAYP